jgi:predicted nucleic acid-binding protein
MTAIDTNILIYACDNADPGKQRRALQVIEDIEDGVLMLQVACEFVSASRKLVKQGFTPSDAWARLSEFQEVLPLVLPRAGALAAAAELHIRRKVSCWDAMIIAACLDCKAGRLLTEDVPSSLSFGSLAIANPFEP